MAAEHNLMEYAPIGIMFLVAIGFAASQLLVTQLIGPRKRTATKLMGEPDITEHVCSKLGIHPGETTEDGQFTVSMVECLGSCVTAPVCQVNDDFFENLTPQKIKEIVAALRDDKVPPHMSNGPSLEGGRCSYKPMIEAYPEGK